jgi:hypothetical protein
VMRRSWGTWSQLSGAGSAPGGIAEILHDWARKVDSASARVTEGLGASAFSAPPLSPGTRPDSIFGTAPRK